MTEPDDLLTPVSIYRHRKRHGDAWPTHRHKLRNRRRRHSSLRRRSRTNPTTDDARRSA